MNPESLPPENWLDGLDPEGAYLTTLSWELSCDELTAILARIEANWRALKMLKALGELTKS